MSVIVRYAPAKVNLMLHIVGKRSDNGYHNMQSIFTFVDYLCDFLIFDTEKPFSEQTINENNIIYKVYLFLQDVYKNRRIPCVTHLIKNIPERAGLGGGSSDAACFLYTVLHDIWNIDVEEIIEVARKAHVLGMDVPIFLYRYIYNENYLFLDGIGKFDEITAIKGLKDIFMIVVNDGKNGLSTVEVFKKYNSEFERKMDVAYIVNNLRTCKNSLQKTAVSIDNSVQKIIDDIKLSGAYVSRMAGSGSSCFGLYENFESMKRAETKLRKKYSIVQGNV